VESLYKLLEVKVVRVECSGKLKEPFWALLRCVNKKLVRRRIIVRDCS
jgi:hypothetical protein